MWLTRIKNVTNILIYLAMYKIILLLMAIKVPSQQPLLDGPRKSYTKNIDNFDPNLVKHKFFISKFYKK